jgi:hypothetical protein
LQTRPALLATRNPPPALAAGPLNQALADIRELIAGFKDETKGDNARLRDELKSVKRDIAGLSSKVDKLEGKFDTLVGTSDTAKRQLCALKVRVTGVQNQVANLKTDLDAGFTGLTTRNNESDGLLRSVGGGPIDPRNVSRVILRRWPTRAPTTESAGPFFSFLTMAFCPPNLPTYVRFCAPAVESATFSEPAAFGNLCIHHCLDGRRSGGLRPVLSASARAVHLRRQVGNFCPTLAPCHGNDRPKQPQPAGTP